MSKRNSSRHSSISGSSGGTPRSGSGSPRSYNSRSSRSGSFRSHSSRSRSPSSGSSYSDRSGSRRSYSSASRSRSGSPPRRKSSGVAKESIAAAAVLSSMLDAGAPAAPPAPAPAAAPSSSSKAKITIIKPREGPAGTQTGSSRAQRMELLKQKYMPERERTKLSRAAQEVLLARLYEPHKDPRDLVAEEVQRAVQEKNREVVLLVKSPAAALKRLKSVPGAAARLAIKQAPRGPSVTAEVLAPLWAAERQARRELVVAFCRDFHRACVACADQTRLDPRNSKLRGAALNTVNSLLAAIQRFYQEVTKFPTAELPAEIYEPGLPSVEAGDPGDPPVESGASGSRSRRWVATGIRPISALSLRHSSPQFHARAALHTPALAIKQAHRPASAARVRSPQSRPGTAGRRGLRSPVGRRPRRRVITVNGPLPPRNAKGFHLHFCAANHSAGQPSAAAAPAENAVPPSIAPLQPPSIAPSQPAGARSSQPSLSPLVSAVSSSAALPATLKPSRVPAASAADFASIPIPFSSDHGHALAAPPPVHPPNQSLPRSLNRFPAGTRTVGPWLRNSNQHRGLSDPQRPASVTSEVWRPPGSAPPRIIGRDAVLANIPASEAPTSEYASSNASLGKRRAAARRRRAPASTGRYVSDIVYDPTPPQLDSAIFPPTHTLSNSPPRATLDSLALGSADVLTFVAGLPIDEATKKVLVEQEVDAIAFLLLESSDIRSLGLPLGSSARLIRLVQAYREQSGMNRSD